MEVKFLDNNEINISITDNKLLKESSKIIKDITPDFDFNKFSPVNNHELFIEILMRKIIAELFKNYRDKLENDITYFININVSGDLYRYTIRNVTINNKVKLKGITYGMSMYK